MTDILDLSRIEEGKVKIITEPFFIDDVLKQVVELFDPISKKTGISMQVDAAHEVYNYVLGDEIRLHQILTNLVGRNNFV